MKNKIILICLFCFSLLSGVDVTDTVHSTSTSYTVVRELGAGAFGRVFAVKSEEGQEFAMKVYQSGSDEAYTDMDREFERGRVLDHPHIIKAFERFNGDYEDYLILQLVRGKTLHYVESKSLNKTQGIKAALQFADALRYAHKNGYIHLDLHSGNIMVSDNQEAMVIDLASFFNYEELIQEISESSYYSKSPKNEKVQKFFAKFPELLEELQAVPKFAQAYEKKIASVNKYYFNWVVERIHTFLDKTELSREEYLHLAIKVNTLSLEFDYDVDSGSCPSLEDKFDELVTVFSEIW